MAQPKLNPADFRHRITFQQKINPNVDSDGFRLPKEQTFWEDVVTVWAMAKTAKLYQGLETTREGATQNIRDTRWVIRYRKGLTEDMRVVFNGRIFEIVGILQDDELKQTLTIACKEVF